MTFLSEENVYVNWHLLLFLTTLRDTLDLMLDVKRNLSNIHTVREILHAWARTDYNKLRFLHCWQVAGLSYSVLGTVCKYNTIILICAFTEGQRAARLPSFASDLPLLVRRGLPACSLVTSISLSISLTHSLWSCELCGSLGTCICGAALPTTSDSNCEFYVCFVWACKLVSACCFVRMTGNM